MSEEEKEAIKHFKNYENKLVYEINEKDKKYAKTLLNLIEKLQKENEEKEKTIDLIIDDFQAENYFIGMTNKEVREYYKKRKELKE